MNRRTRIHLVLLPSLLICCGCGHLSRFSYVERQMGVDFRIVAYAKNQQKADRAARSAFDRIAALNKICSDYDAESELRQLGAAEKVGIPQPISDDLLHVLQLARDLGAETNGAFDVSVGPMILLWRQARGRHQLPVDRKLQIVKSRVGSQQWHLDSESQRVTTHVQGMKFDLGAIAKGYAADEALAVLAQAGITNALVDGGGDVALGKPPPGTTAWRVRIEGGSGPMDLLLHNCGVATSGDTEQFVEIDGQRYSHIVDPRTGIGMTNRALVTTIAKSAALADAAASAITVMGAEKGIEWAVSRQLEARIEALPSGSTPVRRTPGFPAEKPIATAVQP